MATIVKANNTTALNLTGSWVGGVVPTSADIAQWNSTVTGANAAAIGGALSVLGLSVTNPGGAITIGTNAVALTINASGIDLSSATQNLTIASPVTLPLGATQGWSVASGRTLTISSTISGSAKNVTISGAGTTVLNTGINTSWTSSIITIASDAFVQANANRVLGATTNTVEVQSGGALYLASLSVASVNNFTVAGSGVSGKQAGALFIAAAGDFASGKTITLTGASPTIGIQAGAQGGTISGTPTGDVTFNMFGTNITAATFSAASSFTVANGNYLVLQGINPTSGVATAADFCVATADLNGMGNSANAVKVKSTVRLTGTTSNNVTLSRNYFFEGEAGNGTPSSPNVVSIAPVATLNTGFTLQGTITGTSENWVKTGIGGGSAAHFIQFGSASGGKLDGSWNLRSFSSFQTIRFHSNLDISTWFGDIWTNDVSYGVAPTGAATWNANNTIDNIKGSALTLAHSSYTITSGGTGVTFTGTNEMSLGSGAVSFDAAGRFYVAASRLTVPGNISCTSFTSAGAAAGILRLSGNNTFSSNSFAHTGGILELNSAGSAGQSATTFTISATTANTLDSTTGATLTQNGAVALSSVFVWRGTDSLTFGTGNVTASVDPVITFASTGTTGTLKFSGAVTTATATTNWNIGGATAGAKQRVTLGGANASLADNTAANQHAITSGYFRVENSNGLGAAATQTTWWVGATNLGGQTAGAKGALELANVTTPDTKSVNLYNLGPDDDGALIGASGTSTFSGNISVPNVAGTRIGVKTGATLTLLGSGTYQTIQPANANTPISFTAASGGTLNQNRILGTFVGDVSVANSSGTVILSRANTHTGAMTCSSGTTKLTHVNAAGSGAGNSVTVAPGATMEVTVKAVFPATLTLGSSGSAATFKVSV